MLRQPSATAHDVAVRWRQLVDLVARAGPESNGPAMASALEVIRRDLHLVDEPLRAAAARAVAALPLPGELFEIFLRDRLAVSAPVLASASFDRDRWSALLESADAETRRFVEALHPEVTAIARTREADSPMPRSSQRPSHTTISDVLERIERRRHHSPETVRSAVRRGSGEGVPAAFRWECDPNGEIAWVEGVPRGGLIGRDLFSPRRSERDRLDPDAVRAFERRAPFRDAGLELEGAGSAAGRWRLSAVPAFDPNDGRFSGYRGAAVRISADRQAMTGTDLASTRPDPVAVRELVHELRTPINAIIGFAEIIDGQYLGPAGQEYRARATEIVGQAKLLLESIDDLDFLAQSASESGGATSEIDLLPPIRRAVEILESRFELAGAGVHLASATPVFFAIDAAIAERLVTRFLNAVAALAQKGERLSLTISRERERAVIRIDRPRGLAPGGIGDPSGDWLTMGSDESALFPLGLARGLARLAGGELVAEGGMLELWLPGN